MSNPADTIPAETPVEVVVKQSKLDKYVVTPIRNHPKIALAIVAGVALFGGAALVASKDSDTENSTESDEDNVAEDTTVA